MKLIYKKLGDFIVPCDELNTDCEIATIEDLQGISNEKYFQGCKSNKNDIDLSRYRICRNGWFAYNRATTRNGEKISIAYREGADCLVSPSYKCFRIKDETLLNPHYLMMWFKRSEFDRYARFMSHGSAHEYFEYEQMCNVELPIPPIEEQRKIVHAYQVIQDRIELKKAMNDNLEEQLKALFHNLFDDSEELNPCTIGDFGNIIAGATPSTEVEENFCTNGIVWLSPKDLTSSGKKFINKGETDITEIGYKSCSTKLMPKGTVLLTSRAPVGTVAISTTELCTNQGFKSIVPKKELGSAFVYFFLKENKALLDSHSSGTTFMEISGTVLKNIPAFIPPDNLLKTFNELCTPVFDVQMQNEAEIQCLYEIQSLLITRISNS